MKKAMEKLAAYRSKAVLRLLRRWEKWQQFPYHFSPGKAYEQAVKDFQDTSRIPDPQQRKVILHEFRQRLHPEEGNGTPHRKGASR
jgi:hypothetical protein